MGIGWRVTVIANALPVTHHYYVCAECAKKWKGEDVPPEVEADMAEDNEAERLHGHDDHFDRDEDDCDPTWFEDEVFVDDPPEPDSSADRDPYDLGADRVVCFADIQSPEDYGGLRGQCAGRPARRWWRQSTTMKEVRTASAPRRALSAVGPGAKRRQERA